MLSFKAMAVYMIKHPKYYKQNLEEELSDLIDDCINVWHITPKFSVELIAYLGLTWDEYALWVMHPSSFFRDLIQAHTSQNPVG